MDIWSFIASRHEAGHRLMLIVVIDVKGSSPGKKGFKMAVSSDGELFGSIGGGVMEYNMVELAKRALQANERQVFLKKQVHAPDAGKDSSGLICAGEQMHAFIPLGVDNELEGIQTILRSRAAGQSCIMQLSEDGFFVVTTEAFKSRSGSLKQAGAEETWFYTEEIRPPDTLYIFGGGHISIPLSQVCRMIGFRVVVVDNRSDLNTMTSNDFAHKKELINYQDASSCIVHPATSYVCIMTVSHASDQQILEQMIGLKPAYLGMIGSRKKVDKIFSNLKQKGISASDLDNVDAPMGISINSETPAEIAVSIAARIIMERNRDRV